MNFLDVCMFAGLFGDTVNTASRMESHGQPGKIHMSQPAKDNMKESAKYEIQDCGENDVKGKGRMRTWLLQP